MSQYPPVTVSDNRCTQFKDDRTRMRNRMYWLPSGSGCKFTHPCFHYLVLYTKLPTVHQTKKPVSLVNQCPKPRSSSDPPCFLPPHLIVSLALRVARQKPLELLRDDVGLGPAGPGVRAPAAPLVALGGNSIENILT